MKVFISIVLCCCVDIVAAQTPASSFDYKPSFSAIIVKDVAASSKWYSSLFDLKVRDRVTDEKGAYDVYILESPKLVLELLQIKASLPKKELLAGKGEGTEVHGYFKFGFNVKDINACLRHLKSLNIDVPQVWTDSKTKKRNFLITDPDGNLIQFFEE